MKFYFDDEEIGITKETSHPYFNEIVSEEFYYDISNNLSPFGNDTGSDALADLSRWIDENQHDQGIVKWMFEYIDGFGFKYPSEKISQLEKWEDISQVLEEDDFIIDCIDQAIIGTGFGQLKITGKIDSNLKAITLKAIERQMLINNETLQLRITDPDNSIAPDIEAEIIHSYKAYIERLKIMQSDLMKTK